MASIDYRDGDLDTENLVSVQQRLNDLLGRPEKMDLVAKIGLIPIEGILEPFKLPNVYAIICYFPTGTVKIDGKEYAAPITIKFKQETEVETKVETKVEWTGADKLTTWYFK